jgi:hypothetical protein
MKSNNSPKFEDYLPTIDIEINKRRHKWTLTSLTWMDFDDVAQIIRIHIFKKWHQYDISKPLAPWLNTIIANQIKNLIRNTYSNYSRPCLRCAAAVDATGCKIHGEQCSKCPLYAYWLKRKAPAVAIKMPVSIELHSNEVNSMFSDTSDVLRHAEKIHARMKEVLKPIEYQVYEGLFILHEDEMKVAQKLGYTHERGRARYKQIKNIRKTIIAKVKECLASGEIDVY